MDFYHYTDKECKNNILRSGMIIASSGGAYGPGVYGTTISPEEGRKKVSRNNWDAGEDWQVAEGQGRADCAFKIRIPVDKVTPARSSRDIYIHRGNLRLADYHWELLEYPGEGGWWCQIL